MRAFDNNLFLGYVNQVNPEYIKIHFPTSTLLDKTIIGEEELNGGLVGSYVTIEGENVGFIGRIIEVVLPEKERLTFSDSKFRNTDFHPTARVEILMAFDYFDTNKILVSAFAFPNIGAKVYICRNEFFGKFIKRFGGANKDDLMVKIGTLISDDLSEINVSQQALFSRHCAIVGTTGGGKSWTLARLLEEMKKNKTKAIIIDPTGEYTSFESDECISVAMGQNAYFSYKNLTMEDLYYLVKPSEGVQSPKLKEAVTSLKLLKYYNEIKNDGEKQNNYPGSVINNVKQYFEQEEGEGLKTVKKSGNCIKNYELFHTYSAKYIENNLDFEFNLLSKQIREECIWINQTKFGDPDERALGFCTTLQSRVSNLGMDPSINNVFNFKNNDNGNKSEITNIIDNFLKNESEQMLLRIGFENISYEFEVREILANAIGKYLLNKSRKKALEDNPIVLFVDEAHQFLNNKVKDDYFETQNLSAFDQIAKESRKNGLFLCLATQMPRDIPVGTLSQVGTFVVHRLINYSDKEAIKQACSSASMSILSYLPILGEGEAILTGVEFPMPLILKINAPNTKPISDTPRFKNSYNKRKLK
ncbi:ATP-binding protein [Staphylococcus simulans]|uniref:ATP-binding protein n=1 Tax=Staphylococcus simulans TaxID=1286 RepID=UPI001F28A918|nr:ATP-binding protein [Staphylococcus simulans]